MSPRWRKVLGDLISNKTRTLLVALSIGVGVFTVGMIAEGRERMLRGLTDPYLATTPFSAALATEDPFDEDLVNAVEAIEGVQVAEGSKSLQVRMQVGPSEWKPLVLRAIDDWDDIRIARMSLEQGPWPPPDNAMLIERSALSETLGVDLTVGQNVRIQTLDQLDRDIPIVGVVHDLHVAPTFIFGTYYGYITADTLEWLGESRTFSGLRFMVDEEQFYDRAFVEETSFAVRDKIERSGVEVGELWIPPEPGESPIVTFAVTPIIFIMSALGVLAVFLSGFLVTNTIMALLAQQVRQIGIMKAVGARSDQIFGMYLVLVAGFGVVGLIIAMPLAQVAAGVFTDFFAGLFNFDSRSYGVIPSVLVLQLFVGLFVPVVAAIIPVIAGTSMPIREALSSDSGPGSYGQGILDQIINNIRGVSRPLLLSLRNTFRRKGRLALTLITLILGGAIFISVQSVQASIDRTLDNLFASLVRYDVVVNFVNEYREVRLEEEARNVPGVAAAETWGSTIGRRLRPNDTESSEVFIEAPPANSTLLDPEIIEGRWLLPADENAIVLSSGWKNDESDIVLGDTITLKVRGRESDWVVVGFYRSLGGDLSAYANKAYFDQEMREVGSASNLNIVTTSSTPAFQEETARALEDYFRAVGLDVSSTNTAAYNKQQAQTQFGIITTLLMIMAVLIAVVGGLGLMGTMSMNVLERTREIGVMRAIGASDGSILNIVIVEGIIIGSISWIFAAALALPLSQVLNNEVGILFAGAPFTYVYSVNGALLWLGIVVTLSTFASFLPAWNASRLTIREVLAYE